LAPPVLGAPEPLALGFLSLTELLLKGTGFGVSL